MALKVVLTKPVGLLLKGKAREKQTRDLQFEFDSLFKKIKAITVRLSLSEAKKLLIELQHRCSHHFKKTSTIDELFLSINASISWFHYDVLHYILDHVEQEDVSSCKEELAQYGEKLKLYMEERVTSLEDKIHHLPLDLPFPIQEDNNHHVPHTLVLDTDRAWEEKVFDGENCNKTSHKIAAILEKSGHVHGHYHKPWLFVFISGSQSNNTESC